MMTLLSFLAACCLSGAGLAWLAAINPKRRRVYGLPRRVGRGAWQAWGAASLVLLPGLALPALGQVAAFVLWLGAVTVMGWLIALRRPALAAAR